VTHLWTHYFLGSHLIRMYSENILVYDSPPTSGFASPVLSFSFFFRPALYLGSFACSPSVFGIAPRANLPVPGAHHIFYDAFCGRQDHMETYVLQPQSLYIRQTIPVYLSAVHTIGTACPLHIRLGDSLANIAKMETQLSLDDHNATEHRNIIQASPPNVQLQASEKS
jgi:hypothetical protein